jgi:hypothetical protein
VLLFFGACGLVEYVAGRITATGFLSATVDQRTIAVRVEMTTNFFRRQTIS